MLVRTFTGFVFTLTASCTILSRNISLFAEYVLSKRCVTVFSLILLHLRRLVSFTGKLFDIIFCIRNNDILSTRRRLSIPSKEAFQYLRFANEKWEIGVGNVCSDLILCCVKWSYKYTRILFKNAIASGYEVVQLLEALTYNPENCGFDSRWDF